MVASQVGWQLVPRVLHVTPLGVVWLRLVRLFLTALRIRKSSAGEIGVKGTAVSVSGSTGERVHVEAILRDCPLGVVQVISVADEELEVALPEEHVQ